MTKSTDPPIETLFHIWRMRMGFKTGAKAARALGISPRTARRYDKGDSTPDKRVRLAMAAIAWGLAPWSDKLNND